MAQFLQSEAIDVNLIEEDNEGEDVITAATVSDNEFIDDSEQPQQEYPYFSNVTRTYEDAMQDIENLEDLELRHYFDSDEEEDLHEFQS